jgi:ABC-type branched-subunit amino acid transport system substrate-binding protein
MTVKSRSAHQHLGRILITSCLLLIAACIKKGEPGSDGPIKVGVVHALTGTMALSAKPVADATLMAIDEINQQGGLLGRKIQPILVDGRSDPATFARESERLITEERVKVIFGFLNSASRKTGKPVFERHNHLLFYPLTYEGLEQSPNIIYTGAAPNQQVIPAVKWCFDNLGKRFFLVGSDLVHSRAVQRDDPRSGGRSQRRDSWGGVHPVGQQGSQERGGQDCRCQADRDPQHHHR